MATLKDFRFAMTGEGKESESATAMQKADAQIVQDIRNGNPQTDVADSEWILFKLVLTNRQGGIHLPNMDDVINPATITKENPTGDVERMRLLTGVPSVWMKDQKDLTPDYVKAHRRTIVFPRGMKVIKLRSVDKAAITFMRLTNSNIGSPSKIQGSRFEFYEYDPAKAEKEAADKEFFALEMAIEAKQMPLDEMKKHANFLGISLSNDMGMPKGEDGIRREYIMRAKNDPTYFKQTMKSKQVDITYLVRVAISDSRIEVGREPGRIFWAKNGGMIGAYPPTETPEQYLVNLAMTNSAEGKQFLDQLQALNT